MQGSTATISEKQKQSTALTSATVNRSSLLAAVVLCSSFAVLFAPVCWRLVAQWYQDPDYSHGFLVPVFSGYLLWRRRSNLLASKIAPSAWGIPIITMSLGLLFLGDLGAEVFLTRIALLSTLIGLVIFIWGFAVLRAAAFPIAFLVFMIPLPAIIYNQIVFPLQLLASRFAGGCLQTSHIMPVLREGNLLIIPNYTLEVVEACSGIRSLISLLALATAFGYIAESSVLLRFTLALSMIPIAVLSNGFRVVLTAVLTYYFGPRAGEGFVHTFAGMTIFLAATIMLFGLHLLLKQVRKRLSARAF